MPLYLGIPIAISLWLVVAILVVIMISLVYEQKYKMTKYNELINKAVKEELRKREKERTDDNRHG